MKKISLSILVIIFSCARLLLAMNSSGSLKAKEVYVPVSSSKSPAPWTKAQAPHAFDATLTVLATCRGCEILIHRDYEEFSLVLSSKRIGICSLSADGSLIAAADKAFGQYMVAIFDQDRTEYGMALPQMPACISVSALDSSLVACVYESTPNIVKLYDFINKTEHSSYCNKEGITRIALSADGKMLALLCGPSGDRDAFLIKVLDVVTGLLSVEFALAKKVVNIHLAEFLVIEVENQMAEREILKIALFD